MGFGPSYGNQLPPAKPQREDKPQRGLSLSYGQTTFVPVRAEGSKNMISSLGNVQGVIKEGMVAFRAQSAGGATKEECEVVALRFCLLDHAHRLD